MQEQPAEKIRVLIVEEAAVLGVETQTALQKMGYDVLPPVADTEGALRCISKTRPDIVLMGIVIKGANNGIETARSIREKFDVPVVFIATNSDKVIIKKIKSAGPYGYLIKPFNKDILFNTIELVTHKHRSERSLHNSENQYRH
jgi:DNA-binding NarL/FixJ family response regulator